MSLQLCPSVGLSLVGFSFNTTKGKVDYPGPLAVGSLRVSAYP